MRFSVFLFFSSVFAFTLGWYCPWGIKVNGRVVVSPQSTPTT